MKISLRDLFWLMLLAASVTAWGIEHRRAAKLVEECRKQSWFLRTDRGEEPSGDELKRRAELARLAELSDAELDEHLALLLSENRYEQRNKYEPCLVEMAQRGLIDQLRKHYDSLMAQSDGKSGSDFPDNLELLTALRRTQGMPDPLVINIALDGAEELLSKFRAPRISAIIENVDVGHEAANFHQGSDSTGEQWRFVLADEQGRRVADSNYASLAIGGGLGTIGPFQHGERSTWNYAFDLRCYIAPPRSGKYKLQTLHHNSIRIAHERDFSGLIVLKSEPISIVVNNPTPAALERRRSEVRSPLAILGACAVLAMVSLISSPRGKRKLGWFSAISRRDLCWSILIVAIALGMWFDHRHQETLIVDIRPDAAAEWSIRLADDD